MPGPFKFPNPPQPAPERAPARPAPRAEPAAVPPRTESANVGDPIPAPSGPTHDPTIPWAPADNGAGKPFRFNK